MKNTYISILLLAFALVVFGFRVVYKIQFKPNVTGYLKRAADANTIDLAEQELSRAISYLEAHGLTSGYTSVVYKTPDEDLEFWYNNLKASQLELKQLNSTSALEKTNVLLKLRETLVDEGERTKVTVPAGISVFPNNTFWAILGLLASIFGFLGFVLIVAEAEKKRKKIEKLKI